MRKLGARHGGKARTSFPKKNSASIVDATFGMPMKNWPKNKLKPKNFSDEKIGGEARGQGTAAAGARHGSCPGQGTDSISKNLPFGQIF